MNGPDPACQCHFEVLQACQRAVGRIHEDGRSDRLEPIVREFRPVPPPMSFGDALMAESALRAFMGQMGEALHAASPFCADKRACQFDPRTGVDTYAIDASTYRHWSAERVVKRWADWYGRAFAATHRSAQIAAVKEQLRRNGHNPVRASELARRSACSISVIRRRFKAENSSPHRYGIRVRIVRAFTLIRQTEWKMEAIGRECGWSRRSFFRVFKDVTAFTPEQVRRMTLTDAAQVLDRIGREFRLD